MPTFLGSYRGKSAKKMDLPEIHDRNVLHEPTLLRAENTSEEVCRNFIYYSSYCYHNPYL